MAHDGSGRIAANARLVPAAGAAKMVPHPAGKIVAVGLVLAVQLITAKQQADLRLAELSRAHQTEDDSLAERVAVLRAADQQLSEAVAKLLDGQVPHAELALSRKTAGERLERARRFAEQSHAVLNDLGKAGATRPRDVERAFSRWTNLDGFSTEVSFARAAIALSRKSAVADAAAAALDDPTNTYDAYRRQLDERVKDVSQVAAAVEAVAYLIRTLPIESRRRRSKAVGTMRRACIAAAGTTPSPALTASVFFELPDGEVREVLNGGDLFEARTAEPVAKTATPT